MPHFRKQTSSERKALSERLVLARKDARILQKDAAAALKIPPSVLCNVESGNRKIDIAELYALARLYKKPMEWFFENLPLDDDTPIR